MCQSLVRNDASAFVSERDYRARILRPLILGPAECTVHIERILYCQDMNTQTIGTDTPLNQLD